MKETSIINNLDLAQLYTQLTDSQSLKVYLWTSVCLFLAYASELGQFTFSSDYYHSLLNIHPPTSYSHDGRFLAEIIRFYILDGVLPPAMLLIIGVSLLVISANIIAIVWGTNGIGERVIAGLLLAVFPFFYESFSYINMRHIIPLAILLSILGVVTGGFYEGVALKLKGFIFLYSSLFLYQVSLNCAAVIIFMWSILSLYETNNIKIVLSEILLPKLSMVIVSLVAYKLTIYFIEFIGVSQTSRFSSFSKYPQNINQVIHSVLVHFNAMFEYFYKESFLFPKGAKIIATSILFIAIFMFLKKNVYTKNYINLLFMMILVLFGIISTHGLVIPFYPPEKFLFSRILVAYSLFNLSVFLLAIKFYGDSKSKIIVSMASIIVIIYIIQANMWHQYLSMKNHADINITEQISDRLKSNILYKPNLPLAIVGTMQADEYRYRLAFNNPTSLINTSIIKSVYSMDWSKNRLLKFYMSFKTPNHQQMKNARLYALTHKPWPHPEAVTIKNDVMIVVLDKNI